MRCGCMAWHRPGAELGQERTGSRPQLRSRVPLLVDRQFHLARENEVFQARLRRAKLRANACVEDIDYRAARGIDQTLVRALTADSAWVDRHGTTCCRVGKKLSGMRAGAQGVSRRPLGILHTGSGVVSRSGFGASRRNIAQLASAAEQIRRAGGR